MSITVKFDGKYQGTIHGVTPHDVKIIGKRLFVKGVIIPIKNNLIFRAFKVFEDAANSQCGTLYIEFRANGDVMYSNETSTHGVLDWGIGKILGFGSPKYWQHISNDGFSSAPDDDTYMEGKYKYEIY